MDKPQVTVPIPKPKIRFANIARAAALGESKDDFSGKVNVAITGVIINSRAITKNWNNSTYRKQAIDYINSATEKQLKSIMSSLGNAANKRISRIKSAGVPSPAVDALQDRMGTTHFSIRGLGRNELFSNILMASKFLSSETSTLGGAREHWNSAFRRLGFEPNMMNENLVRNVYDIIEKVKEVEGYTQYQFNYERLANELYNEFGDLLNMESEQLQGAYDEGIGMFDEMIRTGMEKARALYEEEQAEFSSRFESMFPKGKKFEW